MWWEDTVFPPPSAERLPREVDVVIVGAGFTGLAAALEMSRRGRSSVVLERATLGAGASGRNAGMVHAGLRYDLAALERRYGAAGRALHQVSADAYAFVGRLAGEVAPDSCYESGGWLHLAHSEGAMRRLERSEASRQRGGETTDVLAGRALATETGAHGFHGALLTDNGSGIHPARYLAGLACAATAAGAQIAERVRVLGVTRDGTSLTASTSAGRVRARDVLVATNGYTDRAFPQLRRRVIPIGSYVVATEPLDRSLAAAVSPRRRMMSDTRNFLHYWRLSPDDRLIFGGRTSFTPVSIGRARDRLHAAMTHAYPQLRDARISHAWMGNVGFTFDRIPHMGRADGVTYAMGYCGSGVAMASWFGTLAAAWIAGGERNAFLDLPFPTLSAYRGTPWFLPAVGWYYQIRDLLG